MEFLSSTELDTRYRRAHTRKNEIIHIAQEARMLVGGSPGLGLNASTIIQDLVNMRLLEDAGAKGTCAGTMEIFSPHRKLNGLRSSDPARSAGRATLGWFRCDLHLVGHRDSQQHTAFVTEDPA